jgi:hypothetical protein
MIDESNKSDKPAPNSIRGYGEELAEELKSRSLSEQKDRERAKQFGDAEELLRTTSVPYRLIKAGFKSLPKDPTQIGSIKEDIQHRIRTHTVKSLERAKSQLSNIVSNEFTSTAVNSAVAEVAYSPEISGMAQAYKDMPYAELQKIKSTELTAVSGAGSQAKALTKKVFTARTITDPNNMGSEKAYAGIEQQIEARNKSANVIAAVETEERRRKSLGEDPRSQETMRFGYQNKATKMVEQEEIRKTGKFNITDPESGKQKSVELKDATQELTNLFKMLAEDTKKLSTASIEEAKIIEEKNKKTTEAIKKTEQALESNTGGTGGASRSQWASAAAGGFGAVGSGVQQVMVNQRLQQMGNIAGFGNIENQKYDMYKAGRSGDVMSQMLLGGFGTAEKFGKELATGQGVANTAFLAGGVAQTAAGGFQMVEGAAQKNPVSVVASGLLGNAGNATAETLSGASNIAQGLSTTAVTGFDIGRKISTSQAQIQGTQASMEAQRAMLAIPAAQMQGFRDYGVGISVAAQGMGSKGEAFLKEGMTPGNLQKMTNSRISPEQMAQMSQVGVQQMGSQFNQEQIFTARNLERSGMGSMGDNMQRMATLAQAGSNNPQAGLASVMEAALTKGLDSSKALNLVAENTASLVQASSARAMGFDTTAAAATVATAAIDKGDPNQEFAARRAMQVQDLVGGIGTDVGTNFAAMAATSRIAATTGLGGEESVIAQGFSDVDLKTMREEKDQSKVAEKLRMRGINVKGGDEAKKLIDTLTEDRLTTTLGVGGTGMATGAAQYAGKFAKEVMKDPNSIDKLIEAQKAGKYESKDQEAYLQSASKAAGLKGVGVDEYLRGAAGIITKNDPNAIKSTKTALEGEGGSKELQSLDKLRTSGFAQLSDAALQATKSFEKLGGALKVLTALNEKMEDVSKKGGEAKFATAAVDSAASFGKHTFEFGAHVGEFGKWITSLNLKAGTSSDTVRSSDTASLNKLINSNYNTRKDSSSRGH